MRMIRKITSLLLTILLVTGIFLQNGLFDAVSVSAAVSVMNGDLNGDGALSIADAVLLVRLLTEDGDLQVSEATVLAADADGDGMLTLIDLTVLLKKLGVGYTFTNETDAFPAVSSQDRPEVPKPSGNSAPFSEETIPGLTLSAEANAFSYDGQLTVSELTEEEGMALMDKMSADENTNVLMLRSWKVEAGLEPDEYLPGTFRSEFDLSVLEMPEELYPNMTAFRIDDNGAVQRFATKLDGNILSWNSNQNSLIVLGILTSVGVMIGGHLLASSVICWIGAACLAGVVTYKLDTMQKDVWDSEELKSLCYEETDHFTVWYSRADDSVRQRETRIKLKEKAALDKARKEAETEAAIRIEKYGFGFREYVNRLIPVLQKEYLDADPVYQADLADRKAIPADVILLMEYLEEAYRYNAYEQGTGELSYKPDVLFCPKITDDGNAVTTQLGLTNPFILVKRDPAMVQDAMPMKKGVDMDKIYGKVVNAALADSMLLTVTHELFHLMQNKCFPGKDIRHLKCSEMTAILCEHEAEQYFRRLGMLTTEYTDQNSTKREAMAVAMDDNSRDGKLLTADGYTLANFFEYMERKTDWDFKAWDAVQMYAMTDKQLTKTFCRCFQLGNYPDLDPELLAECWNSYVRFDALNFIDRGKAIKSQKTDAKDGAYLPSQMQRYSISAASPVQSLTVQPADISARIAEVKLTGLDRWTLLLMPEKSAKTAIPELDFVFPFSQSGLTGYSVTRTGYALHGIEDTYYYLERQGFGGKNRTGYTVFLMQPPKAPTAEYDEETKEIKVRLQSQPGEAAKNGGTDCFLLMLSTEDGTVFYSREVPYESQSAEIVIRPEDMIPDYTLMPAVRVRVCEYTQGDENSVSYAFPASDATVLLITKAETTVVTSEVTTPLSTTVQMTVSAQSSGSGSTDPGTGASGTTTSSGQTQTSTIGTGTQTTPSGSTTVTAITTVSGSTVSTSALTGTTTAVTTVTTMTAAVPLDLHLTPRNIAFDYVDGYYEDADIGGEHTNADPYHTSENKYVMQFDKAPVFHLYADGTFSLTVYPHNGRDTGYWRVTEWGEETGELELWDDYEWKYDGFTVYGQVLEDITGKDCWEGIITHCTAASLSAEYKEYDMNTETYQIDTFTGTPKALTPDDDDYDMYAEEYPDIELPPIYGYLQFDELNMGSSEYKGRPCVTMCMNTTGGDVWAECSFFDPYEGWHYQDFEIGHPDYLMTMDFGPVQDAIDLKSGCGTDFGISDDAFMLAFNPGSLERETGEKDEEGNWLKEKIEWSRLRISGYAPAVKNSGSWTVPVMFCNQHEFTLTVTSPDGTQQTVTAEILRPVTGTVSISSSVSDGMKYVTVSAELMTSEGKIRFNGMYSVKVKEK